MHDSARAAFSAAAGFFVPAAAEVPLSKRAKRAAKAARKHTTQRKDGDRYPCGKLRPQIEPQAVNAGEEAVKRQRILAVELPSAATDPLADTELGRARLLRLIDEDEFLAAEGLRKSLDIVFPRQTATSCLANITPSPVGEHDEVVEAREEDCCQPPEKRCGRCAADIRARHKELLAEAERIGTAAAGERAWLMVRALVRDSRPDWCDVTLRREPGEWEQHDRERRLCRRVLRVLLDVYPQGHCAADAHEFLHDAVVAFERRRAERVQAEAKAGRAQETPAERRQLEIDAGMARIAAQRAARLQREAEQAEAREEADAPDDLSVAAIVDRIVQDAGQAIASVLDIQSVLPAAPEALEGAD
jgi:hypothetical protein